MEEHVNESVETATLAKKIEIWEHLSHLEIKGFFISAVISSVDEEMPILLDSYIAQKFNAIVNQGIHARKFLYKEKKWRIYLTFFPTNERVDERYALKNVVMKSS